MKLLRGLGLALLVVVGAAGGLYWGWFVSPVYYTDTDLSFLAPAYKAEAVQMIATRYTQDQDLMAAREALAMLGYTDAAAAVRAVTLDAMQAARPAPEVRPLIALAVALHGATPAMETYAP